MANFTEIKAVADALAALAGKAKSLKSLADQTLANNSALQIDWGNVDAGMITNGDLTGTNASPAEISNVIGSLAAFQTFWETHGGNFEKLTTPIV